MQRSGSYSKCHVTKIKILTPVKLSFRPLWMYSASPLFTGKIVPASIIRIHSSPLFERCINGSSFSKFYRSDSLNLFAMTWMMCAITARICEGQCSACLGHTSVLQLIQSKADERTLAALHTASFSSMRIPLLNTCFKKASMTSSRDSAKHTISTSILTTHQGFSS